MRTGHYTPCKWRCSASFQRVRLGNIKYDVGNIREVETARLPALVIVATDSATAAVLATGSVQAEEPAEGLPPLRFCFRSRLNSCLI